MMTALFVKKLNYTCVLKAVKFTKRKKLILRMRKPKTKKYDNIKQRNNEKSKSRYVVFFHIFGVGMHFCNKIAETLHYINKTNLL